MWSEPKTDWVAADFFNYTDYNRIKNNIELLGSLAHSRYGITISDMGEDVPGYSNTPWFATQFNAFEDNVETMAAACGVAFEKSTFFANAPFITYEELNTLESACIEIYMALENWHGGIRRIPFRLGQFKTRI